MPLLPKLISVLYNECLLINFNDHTVKDIFKVTESNFNELALSIFNYQYEFNPLYQSFCKSLDRNPDTIKNIEQIPFLPVSFFKTHELKTTAFNAELIFESSGTSGQELSTHHVKNKSIYRQSFRKTFQKFYGNPADFCILGLLPSNLLTESCGQRKNSSLVFMVEDLVNSSGNANSGFFLDDFEKLHGIIFSNEQKEISTILIGVTYALLDFATAYPMKLKHTIVIETGGMKGRRKELTRLEVHEILKLQFGLNKIHSEYGMTELLSQAYATGDGIFECPPWMKIICRAEDDPFDFTQNRGAINIIDLANIYSCSFIATDDVCKIINHKKFEVTGRLDNSDIRGCSLMAL